ncbi:MAG TPA: glycosyltransferase family 2 protein [Balneolales bacterium]|nr:glycosyltransferase family 2 protein [Balneolales bacterium]
MENNRIPLFSIIIPTYNRAEFITHAIQSIIEQLVNDWEVIVVDDGSTDNTRDKVLSFDDERIKYVYQNNQERSVARNRGIKEANGEYICFLDSDDWYLPNHLVELRKNIIKNSYPIAFFYTGQYFYADGKYRRKHLQEKIKMNPVEHVLFYTIYPTSVCIHKNIFKKFSFETYLIPAEDRGLWIQIATTYPPIQIDKYTCVVNLHEESTTRLYSNKITLKNYDDELNKLKKVFNYDIVKNYVTNEMIKKYKGKYFFYYMYDSFHKRQPGYIIYFFIKHIISYPKNIFRLKTYMTVYNMMKNYSRD